ncbi:L-rhamnose mutarotase [Cyclobacterium lianum]|uniref:L-rhamnose mutarotase n=1 Tax=Cyclobacterium lianum TaxID=388280 RepID=A0A1M7L959_9BACT|nr:L-rhamnose mutarotase [Cyclobacterium lianum]SHM73899.1 L-rhamnose mutarotase [Cyclobacterium lianum]
MKRYCLALDLVNDPKVISQYKEHHKNIPRLIEKSIRDAGIEVMDIYLTGNRLFMIMEVNEGFSFENKARMDAGNEAVQEWEEMMGKLQKALPWADPGEKWVLSERIFSLNP